MTIQELPQIDKEQERYERQTKIMSGELSPNAIKNRLEKQMQLAGDWAKIKYPKEEINFDSKQFRDKIMYEWSDPSSGLSKPFKDLEDDPGFVTHPRFKGNSISITLPDVLFYKENGFLPKE